MELYYVDGVGHVGFFNGEEYVVNNYSFGNFLTINEHIFYLDFTKIEADTNLIESLIPFTRLEYKSITIAENNGGYIGTICFN